jgi:hypothetical protein
MALNAHSYLFDYVFAMRHFPIAASLIVHVRRGDEAPINQDKADCNEKFRSSSKLAYSKAATCMPFAASLMNRAMLMMMMIMNTLTLMR